MRPPPMISRLCAVGEISLRPSRAAGGRRAGRSACPAPRRSPTFSAVRRRDEILHETIEDRPLDEDAAARATVLAGVGKHAHRRGARRFFDIGIGENDVGRLAAEFEGDAFDARARPGRMMWEPISVEPVKEILRTSGCSTSASPISPPAPGDDLQHARRADRPRARVRPSRSALSGESEAGFSTTQLPAASAGADFPAGNREGKIPRHDGRDDAHRLAQGEIESAPRDGNGLRRKTCEIAPA